jgi:rhodanese-related sulfurtransferase
VKGGYQYTAAKMITGAEQLSDVAKDTEIVLYCVSGSRSNASINYLRQLGFTNVINGINKQQVNAKYDL